MGIDKYGVMIDLGDTFYLSLSWLGVIALAVAYGAYRFLKAYYL